MGRRARPHAHNHDHDHDQGLAALTWLFAWLIIAAAAAGLLSELTH